MLVSLDKKVPKKDYRRGGRHLWRDRLSSLVTTLSPLEPGKDPFNGTLRILNTQSLTSLTLIFCSPCLQFSGFEELRTFAVDVTCTVSLAFQAWAHKHRDQVDSD